MSNHPFAALLLAGGRSVRMGQDKALLDWQGQPLWQAQLQKLRELQPSRILIACREEQGLRKETAPDIEWLFDPPGSDCGPIEPISRALERVQMPLLVLAVDMPCMTADFLHSIPRTRSQFFILGEHFEPLAGCYTPAMLPLLKDALEVGSYSLQKVLQSAQKKGLAEIHPVPENQTRLFANTNTQAEWRDATT